MYSKPIKYAQLKFLHSRWKNSPDSKRDGKQPGIDNVTPRSFSTNLHQNLVTIRNDLINGSFEFSKLKAVFVEKGNGKERVICIPTVKDRLVQRLIAYHLSGSVDKKNNRTDLLKVQNGINFDVIDSGGTFGAIKYVLKYRKQRPWVLKTDICSFFDNIDREMLFAKICNKLNKRSSLIPLLEQIIFTEISDQQWVSQKEKLSNCGLKKNLGIRQGMPLSPLLAGFYLRNFDLALKSKSAKTIRYADDLAIFCESENECIEMQKYVEDELDELGLKIPSLKVATKTFIVSDTEPFLFLGFDIVQKGKSYVTKIPTNSINNIFLDQLKFASLNHCIQEEHTFGGLFEFMKRRRNGYISSYKGTDNLDAFLEKFDENTKDISEKLLGSLLPKDVLDELSIQQRKFLGIM